MKHFIVVTGGVISGLGKGITASTIGLLLNKRGINVTAIKIDPYLNVDAGTMSPYEHGECYVLDDGGEVDLDLGNYERFLNTNLSKHNNITSGKVYKNVIDKERRGDYLGKTVQIVPHVTNEIKNMINNAATENVCLIELGGTVGDIEGMPFVEAIKQLSMNNKVCFVHVSLLLKHGKEFKTKPTQSSIRELNNRGIFPDILCLRTPEKTSSETKEKLQNLCGIKKSNIVDNTNVNNIYEVPMLFDEQNIAEKVASVLGLNLPKRPNNYLHDYVRMSNLLLTEEKVVKCLVLGKYSENDDTYLSIVRSIEHAAFSCNVCPKITIESVDSSNNLEILKDTDCVIIPGGFGTRGIEEKINAIKYCRENNIPILGLCLGFQLMVIEFARNVCGIKNAKSQEHDNIVGDDVIIINPECVNAEMGGTMRLGSLETVLDENSKSIKEYKSMIASERHRHRYEFNKKYLSLMKDKGLTLIGQKHIDILELNDHPYFIGCQFHPEYKTRLETPHPLFVGLIRNASILNR